MSNSKHFIKMHVCRSAFRRRNSLLHEAIEADKADKADKADAAVTHLFILSALSASSAPSMRLNCDVFCIN